MTDNHKRRALSLIEARVLEGDAATERIDELRDAGVDEFVGYPFDASAEGRARTRKLLREYDN